MKCRIAGLFAVASLSVSLSGCGYFDSRAAHKAQITMIGMTSYDLQACAGLPTATKQINDTTQIFVYTGTQPQPSYGGSTLIPIGDIATTIAQLGGGGGTSCSAVIRLDHDRVSDVHYTGNNDEMVGTDGICSIITRGCARQPEGTMQKSAGGMLGPVSAFHPPRTPQQSTTATYSTQSGAAVLNTDKKSTDSIIVPRTQ
ncbi:hypothetical protein APT_01374 [Acetobacter pasteurianus NBRC 101655]|uniref:Lipoprotein n=2 Tax=Acetobacter pasteurianus TaxID=438 RepID=A0A1A0DHX1_ACEPA|nr:hypothetical protein SRCM100623_00602 [Acetobacter pasteurianus]BAU38456.1 hypothetical protein APT_01374 [Acetobacter pasteurianus NBRC 101655]GCD49733.1 hypothetical protein NBRC106471_1289 [Acetobacter pasteurianus subsp. pasteurianus LMG 1262 = NBRC 106471]CCT58353.1 hypothetical protein APA386B_233 [Acetobacter pasteurianus 386B]